MNPAAVLSRHDVVAMMWLVAHQGGWDEILLFVAPLAIAFIAIGAFERRGRKPDADRDPEKPTGHADERRPGRASGDTKESS